MEGAHSLSLAVAHRRQFKSLLSAPPQANAANEGDRPGAGRPGAGLLGAGLGSRAAATLRPQAEPSGGGVTGRAGGGATYQAGAAA